MTYAIILLQAAASSTALYSQLVLIGGFILIFYFFFIRPQVTRQKKERLFREGIKKDDKVVTIGGAIGRVHAVEGDHLMIELDKNVIVKFERSAIKSYVQPPKA
jgi:preprotein translocase subunit YajC